MAIFVDKDRCLNRIEWLNLYSYTALNKVAKNVQNMSIEVAIKYLEDVNRAVYEIKREVIRLHNISK